MPWRDSNPGLLSLRLMPCPLRHAARANTYVRLYEPVLNQLSGNGIHKYLVASSPFVLSCLERQKDKHFEHGFLLNGKHLKWMDVWFRKAPTHFCLIKGSNHLKTSFFVFLSRFHALRTPELLSIKTIIDPFSLSHSLTLCLYCFYCFHLANEGMSE
jgi:hypothetical protein